MIVWRDGSRETSFYVHRSKTNIQGRVQIRFHQNRKKTTPFEEENDVKAMYHEKLKRKFPSHFDISAHIHGTVCGKARDASKRLTVLLREIRDAMGMIPTAQLHTKIEIPDSGFGPGILTPSHNMELCGT